MKDQISPKVGAAAVGSALASVFWVIAAATFWQGTFSDSTLATLTGSSATVLAAFLGWLVPDRSRLLPNTNDRGNQGNRSVSQDWDREPA